MTDKELRRLRRPALLELLLEQSKDYADLQARLEAAETALKSRRLEVAQQGTLAEAALKVNGVYEAAQKAADQYLENCRMRGDELIAQAEARAAQILADAQAQAEEIGKRQPN